MSGLKPASWSYAEEFVPEDEVTDGARRRAEALDVTPVGPGAGATLRLLAAAIAAQAVIEVGTGSGVSGIWLLAGMHPDGVLTTIDSDPERQRAARAAFQEAGIPSQRTRIISGRAAEVLPRMSDAAYDLVLIDADKTAYPEYAEHAIRLLRPGGLLVLDNMLWHDRVADPAVRDAETVVLRNLGKDLRADERLVPALLPVSDGLFVAVRRQ
ncbi:MAG: O-methyltransferase [Nostocoides sp.]